ncbi:uncharacterized protein N0V89_007091 [Didymosphaeria variabile]|uniref:Carboxymuconolactone decarboxylase-like domain-containing protein n=1 Tax=Didymosphaeria variabile TaxID=1932322 RepID=A0A9W8XI82_9PLEO|nr:uncharacterized protein N0V89_007091 [Didymosphaeria variabile]KAJ4351748.1 hypothetical protein N0V89_007091 [Didymosphaeria variabile]
MASDTSNMPTIRPDVSMLFQSIEQAFTTTSLGDHRWYLLTLAALVGGTEPLLADQLYLYIINKSNNRDSYQRQKVVRSLREALVKLVSIIGVCKPLEAILAIAKVERPEDRDYSFSREEWANDSENHERGMSWLRQIYTHNTDSTLSLFDAHKDFRWISTEITYGLYLSDRQNLDDIDTEVVVLVGIMIQNLPLETAWHIRGSRRIGISLEDVKTMMDCVRKVGEFMGTKLDRIPSADNIEKEV